MVLSPAWLVVTTVTDLVRGQRRLPTPRLLAFATLWCWLETAGVVAATALWCVGQSRNESAHYALQRWWAARLIGALRLCVGLRIEVEGTQGLDDGPYIALCRHASLGDALVSAWVFGTHAHLRPRYVLKRELALDPCLDVVGHRIPNYFVNRGSTNLSAELQGIAEMASNLNSGDVAVIFPEGSRANDVKRARALARLETREPERARRLAALRYLMPPKIAGVQALVSAVPEADLLMVWHKGFDGMDSFGGMLRILGSGVVRAKVVVTRFARDQVPTGGTFIAWLDDMWVEMDNALSTSA